MNLYEAMHYKEKWLNQLLADYTIIDVKSELSESWKDKNDSTVLNGCCARLYVFAKRKGIKNEYLLYKAPRIRGTREFADGEKVASFKTNEECKKYIEEHFKLEWF